MVRFCTIDEATRAIKKALEKRDFEHAAQYILSNREPFLTANGYTKAALSPWWITWAERVMEGQIVPVIIPKVDVSPLLHDGDLFGEPITNGMKSKRGRR